MNDMNETFIFMITALPCGPFDLVMFNILILQGSP